MTSRGELKGHSALAHELLENVMSHATQACLALEGPEQRLVALDNEVQDAANAMARLIDGLNAAEVPTLAAMKDLMEQAVRHVREAYVHADSVHLAAAELIATVEELDKKI